MTALRVQVTTLKGKPIERASVVVHLDEGRAVTKLGKKQITHWELRTNSEGFAKIPPLPQGKARIQVIAKGYQTHGDTYDLNQEEQLITIKLNPPQQQYSAH
jgi:hypothetical protein